MRLSVAQNAAIHALQARARRGAARRSLSAGCEIVFKASRLRNASGSGTEVKRRRSFSGGAAPELMRGCCEKDTAAESQPQRSRGGAALRA